MVFGSLLLYLRLGPVDEEKLARGSREGGIEPVDIVWGEHVVGHIALVDIDVGPLPALGFMAGDGIGELYLQSIVVFVLPDSLHAVGLERNVGVVGHDLVKEPLILLTGQGW